MDDIFAKTGDAVITPVNPDEQYLTLEEFIQTETFKRVVEDIVKKTGKQEESVISGLIKSVLGSVSDTACLGLTTVENFIDNITDTATSAIKGINKTVFDLAKDTVRTITAGNGKI